MFFVAVGLAVALGVFVVWIGRLSGKPVGTMLLGLAIAGAFAFGALALESTGWRDTDGWIDCNDYCHGWHQVGLLLFWTPTMTCVLLLAVLIASLVAQAWGRLQRGS